MSRIKRACAQGLADALEERVGKLGQKPTVISAPPSGKAEYPALAVQIDRIAFNYTNDDIVMVDPNADIGDPGYLLAGSYATDENNDLVEGVVYVDPSGSSLSHVGSIRAKGRIWVGTRLPSQREQIEEDIELAFQSDRAAPGRLLVSIAGVTIAGMTIPFGFGTFDHGDNTWEGEHAFEERLWCYLAFDLDAPILIPRDEPIVEQLILAITSDLDTPVDSAEDLSNLADIDQMTVNEDGEVDPYP